MTKLISAAVAAVLRGWAYHDIRALEIYLSSMDHPGVPSVKKTKLTHRLSIKGYEWCIPKIQKQFSALSEKEVLEVLREELINQRPILSGGAMEVAQGISGKVFGLLRKLAEMHVTRSYVPGVEGGEVN